jgi:hypothetical protein
MISVLHIEVVARPYVMSKISYFIVRTFDVKHNAAHSTILINFGSEKNRARNEKIAENDQPETIVYTYNQNTCTLLYKLQRRDESKEQSVNITYLTIFASQGLPSAPPFSFERRDIG